MVSYNPVPGRIYDITCIVSAFSDFEEYANHYKSWAGNQGLTGTTLEIYEFIQKNSITLEDDVSFLFRRNFNNEQRFIGDYLRESGAYTIFDSVNSFIAWIRNLSPDMLLPSFYRYLEQCTGDEVGSLQLRTDATPGEIYSYAAALKLEPRWKLAVLSILLDTSTFVSKLADVLVRCEAILMDVNVRFQEYIRSVESQKYSVQDLNRILENAFPNAGSIDLDDAVNSFSFLNDSMFFYMDAYSPVWLILGSRVEEYSLKNSAPKELNIVLIGKAVGDANRIQILKLLENGPMYATQLAAELKIAHTSLFYHVNLLSDAGLINTTTQGRKTYYAINSDQIARISNYLNEYCEKLKRRE